MRARDPRTTTHTIRHAMAAAAWLCASVGQTQTLKMSWQLGAVPIEKAGVRHALAQPMGLMQAYELALNKDLTYAAALAAYRAVQEQVPQAQAALRPQVSVDGALGVSTNRPRTSTTSSDTAFNQFAVATQSHTTTRSSSQSTVQQAGFPQFDTSTTTSSQSTNTTILNENTAEQLTTQSWQAARQSDQGRAANAEINLRWPIYRPANDRQLELSRLNVAQAEVRVRAARQDVAVRLCRTYFEVILGQENLLALEAEMTAVAAQLRMAEQSFKEGETTIADVKEAQAKWDIVQAQKLAQRNALQVRLTALQALIGQRAAAAQKLRVDDLLNAPPELGAVGDWMARTAQQSYPVLMETLALAAAEKEVSKQSAAFKPSLDLVASIGAGRTLQRTQSESSSANVSNAVREESVLTSLQNLESATSVRNGENAAGASQTSSVSNALSSSQESTQSTSSRPAGNSRSASTQYNAYVGVRLNIPLYDGGFANSKVREAVARQSQKALELELTQLEAAQATETAFLEAQGFFAEANALKTAESSGQVALKSNQMGYQAGVRINADILNAQQQLFAVRRDLIKAQVSALMAVLRLKASSGVLIDQDVEQLGRWLR